MFLVKSLGFRSELRSFQLLETFLNSNIFKRVASIHRKVIISERSVYNNIIVTERNYN